MNKRRRVNTNLVSNKLMMKYTYKKCILPAVVIVIIGLLYVLAISIGSTWASDKLIEKANEQKVKSVYGENLVLEKKITELQQEVVGMEQLIKSTKEHNEYMANPIIQNNYKIEKLISYINEIKPKNVTIILIEDSNIDANNIEGNENIEENTVGESNKPSNEFSLKYRTDIGNSSIQIRGFSTNKESLASFLQSLGQYDGMSSYKVNAIETVKVLDNDLDIFDAVITPN